MDGPADLARLSELGGGPPAGEPDVRGWEVIGADGARIGRVADLIVERQSRLRRFLDVDLEDDLAEARAAALAERSDARAETQPPSGDSLLGDVSPAGASPAAPPAESRAEGEIEDSLPMAGPRPPRMRLPDDRPASDLVPGARHVLLPARGLRLDREAEQVVVPGLSASAAAELPAFLAAPWPAAGAAGAATPARVERGVEGEEDRFYTRADPRSSAPLPPEPGTTPAEVEPADLEAAQAAEPAGPDDLDRGAGSPPRP